MKISQSGSNQDEIFASSRRIGVSVENLAEAYIG